MLVGCDVGRGCQWDLLLDAGLFGEVLQFTLALFLQVGRHLRCREFMVGQGRRRSFSSRRNQISGGWDGNGDGACGWVVLF